MVRGCDAVHLRAVTESLSVKSDPRPTPARSPAGRGVLFGGAAPQAEIASALYAPPANTPRRGLRIQPGVGEAYPRCRFSNHAYPEGVTRFPERRVLVPLCNPFGVIVVDARPSPGVGWRQPPAVLLNPLRGTYDACCSRVALVPACPYRWTYSTFQSHTYRSSYSTPYLPSRRRNSS